MARGQRLLGDDGTIECTEWFDRPAGLDAIGQALRGATDESARAAEDARAVAAADAGWDAYSDTEPGQAPPVSRPAIGATANVPVTEGTVPPAPVAPVEPVVDPDELPPHSGKGSGKDAWIEFADAHGIEVDEDASRDEIADVVTTAMEADAANAGAD